MSDGGTARLCWRCEKYSHMTLLGELHKVGVENFSPHEDYNFAGVFSCDGCRAPSMGLFFIHAAGGLSGSEAKAAVLGQIEARYSDVQRHWFPLEGETVTYDESVPEAIAKTAAEAHLCHSVNAYRASVGLSRATIEAAAKEKGIASGNLDSKLKKLVEEGHIRQYVYEAADTLRLAGNAAMHEVLTVDYSEDDSELFLKVMDVVLREMYEDPAAVLRAKGRLK